MSYGLRLTVKNGIVSVTHVLGSVPDGSYEIHGDSSDHGIFSALRRDTDGQIVRTAESPAHNRGGDVLLPGV